MILTSKKKLKRVKVPVLVWKTEEANISIDNFLNQSFIDDYFFMYNIGYA